MKEKKWEEALMLWNLTPASRALFARLAGIDPAMVEYVNEIEARASDPPAAVQVAAPRAVAALSAQIRKRRY